MTPRQRPHDGGGGGGGAPRRRGSDASEAHPAAPPARPPAGGYAIRWRVPRALWPAGGRGDVRTTRERTPPPEANVLRSAPTYGPAAAALNGASGAPGPGGPPHAPRYKGPHGPWTITASFPVTLIYPPAGLWHQERTATGAVSPFTPVTFQTCR